MTDERIKRPELARDEPLRSFSTLWSKASQTSQSAPADDSQPPDNGASSDFIENGVRSAYSVIDRYMSEGQRIASEMGQSYSDIGLGEGSREVQGRWLQLSSELIANWFDLIGLASETLGPEWAGMNPNSEQAEPDKDCEAIFEIEGARPSRVSARFSPGAQRFELSGGEACGDKNSDAIPFEVRSQHDSDEVVIKFNVQAEQDPGHYAGNIANRLTGELLGVLNIEVL